MATQNSNLQRWLTGIVLAAVLLLVIFLAPPVVLAIVITLAILVGVWEYNGIVFGAGFYKEKIESLVFAVLIPAAVYAGDTQLLSALFAFMVITVFIVFLWRVSESNFDVTSVAKVMFGLLYLPYLTSHFILLRGLENGIAWIMLVLVIAIIGDTVALYTGKALGRHKLLPAVSPGKTVEGTIGLLAGATLSACAFGYFFLPQFAFPHFLFLGLVGGMIGQLGDLCESAIKRNYGRKDASSLLPGHGGLMDRLDSLIFIAPFVYYYKLFVMG